MQYSRRECLWRSRCCTLFIATDCVALVTNDDAKQIFTTLADHGRLSLIALRRLTGINIRRLQSGLTTLTQHHIVLHYAADEDEPTFFQVDWYAAYVLVRSRKMTTLVRDREGEAAGQIVANILQLGHASVGDLVDEQDLTSGSKRDSGIDTVEHYVSEEGLINGIAKDGKQNPPQGKITTASDYHQSLGILLRKGYVVKVNERTYVPFADLQDQLRDTVISEGFRDGKVTGPKKQKEYNVAVNRLKRKWQDEDSFSETKDIGSRGKIKHTHVPAPTNKRLKTNGDLPNGIHTHACDKAGEDVSHSVQKLPVLCCCPSKSIQHISANTNLRITWLCV